MRLAAVGVDGQGLAQQDRGLRGAAQALQDGGLGAKGGAVLRGQLQGAVGGLQRRRGPARGLQRLSQGGPGRRLARRLGDPEAQQGDGGLEAPSLLLATGGDAQGQGRAQAGLDRPPRQVQRLVAPSGRQGFADLGCCGLAGGRSPVRRAGMGHGR